MLTFRFFDHSDQDYATVVALYNAVFPDMPLDAAEMRRADSIRPKTTFYQRIIAELDGNPVGSGGYMELKNVAEADNYQLWWLTSAEYRKQGICTAFYDHALANIQAAERTIATIRAFARETHPDGIRWLTAHGFIETDRYLISALELAKFDSTQFANYTSRIAQHGLIIKPLSEIIPHDPQWQRKLYDLEWILNQDEPNSTQAKQRPFEQFVERKFEDPRFSPAMWFIVLDGDHFAGMTCFWPNKAHAHKLDTGWTGVDRPYRKKGVAMALKLTAINFAQQQPTITHLETDNHETNWMYQINLRLGFKPLPAAISYEKSIGKNTG